MKIIHSLSSYGKLSALVVLLVSLSLLSLFVQAQDQAQTAEKADYKLQWPSFPLDLIVVEYEKLTGKKVIMDINVMGTTMTISTSLPLTKTGAITFIEKSLLLNGYAFVPSGKDTVKLIAIGGGKDPRSEGVPFISDVSKLPDTDQVVNFVMEFTHIQPAEAATIIERVMPLHEYGQLTPVEGTPVMLVSENASTIRSMAELRDKIDVPPTETERKSFQLERADAEVVAEHLNQLLGAQAAITQARTSAIPARTTTIRQGAGVTPVRRAPTARTPASTNQNAFATFHIVAVRRTNRIMAIARPLDMVYIESLIEEFDAPAAIQTFLKRSLNYISVEDFFPIIAAALSRGVDDSAGGQGGRNTQPRRSASINATRTGGAGGTSTLSGGVSLGEPEDQGAPQSMVVGKTLLISNPEDNSVLVSGPPEHLEIVKALLKEMDVKPRQIYLSTVIGQLTIGDDLNYGIDIVRTVDQFRLDQDSVRGAGSFFTRGDTGAVVDPDLLNQVADLPSTAGLSVYGKFNDKLSAYLSALEATNRFKILSRPSVVTRNNKKAVISVGEQVPVPSQTLTNLNGGLVNPGSVTSNITFRDVVLKLEIIPLINSDNEVTLQVAQVNDNIVSSIVISGNEIPVIGTQELTTTVTVPNKDTVLLGGLISESDNESHNGFPWLLRVPIIKHLLGTTQKSTRRQELLIFIQPFIINNKEDLAQVHLDMTRRAEISDEGVEFAIPEVKAEREESKRRWFDFLKKKKEPVPIRGAFTEPPEYRNPRAVPIKTGSSKPQN